MITIFFTIFITIFIILYLPPQSQKIMINLILGWIFRVLNLVFMLLFGFWIGYHVFTSDTYSSFFDGDETEQTTTDEEPTDEESDIEKDEKPEDENTDEPEELKPDKKSEPDAKPIPQKDVPPDIKDNGIMLTSGFKLQSLECMDAKIMSDLLQSCAI